MPFLILFILLSLPIVEIASILYVSAWIGPLPTFLLLAASAALGLSLIRSQSLSLGRRLVEAMDRGAPPEKPLLDSAMASLAGVLFIIPGFVTDIVAILMLVPQARQQIWRAAVFGVRSGGFRRWQAGPGPRREARAPLREDNVIDAEFTEVPPERPSPEGKGPEGRSDSPWNKPR